VTGLGVANAELSSLVTESLLTEVVSLVPEEWLPVEDRRIYVEYLAARAAESYAWLPRAVA
jgi:hypothetical protein